MRQEDNNKYVSLWGIVCLLFAFFFMIKMSQGAKLNYNLYTDLLKKMMKEKEMFKWLWIVKGKSTNFYAL